MPGREASRRQAQAALPELEKKFRDAFRKVGFPVYLSGDFEAVETFTMFAGDVHENVQVSYAVATAPLRNAVRATVGNNREFGVSGFSVLVREAKALGALVGLTSMNQPTYRGSTYVADDAALDKVIDSYLTEQLGAEFLAPLIEQAACVSALAQECDSSVVPVLVTDMPENVRDVVQSRIFGGRFVEAEIDGEVTESTVENVFKDVQAALKSRTTKEQ